MCVVLIIHYACSHHRPMPAPIYNICEPKQVITRIRGQQARCLPEATVTWDMSSTNVCPVCSGSIYRYEKRYELVRKLEDLGLADRLSPMAPLDEDEVRMWKIWVADRERFRKVGVRGGKNGELGQGMWSLRERRGFEEWYTFDGFLGRMGPYRRGEVKGLEAWYKKMHPEEMGVGDAEEGEEEAKGEGEGLPAAHMPGKWMPRMMILGATLEPKVEAEGEVKAEAEAEGEAKAKSKPEGEAEGSGRAGKKKKSKKSKSKNKNKGKGTEEVEEKAQVGE